MTTSKPPIGPDEMLDEEDNRVECPTCRGTFDTTDLAEHFRHTWQDEIVMECPKCRAPLTLHREISVHYMTSHAPENTLRARR